LATAKGTIRQTVTILLAPSRLLHISNAFSEDTENCDPLDIAISYRGSLLMFMAISTAQDALVLFRIEPQDQKATK